MASNVYSKLNQARIKMQECGIKQNGCNDFAKYKYFELFDILPASNKICAELNVTIYTQFDKDTAHLFFVDAESTGDGVIEFTLPMSTANLKGCHEVQNLGAVQTYLKRYLYQNCYELSEGDILDKTMNPNEKPQTTKAFADVVKVAEATAKIKAEAELVVKKFEALAGEDLISQESLTNMQNAYSKLKTDTDYASFIKNCNKNIQEAEKKKVFNDDNIPF